MSQFQAIADLQGFLEVFFEDNFQQRDFFWLDSGNGEYTELGRFSFFGMHALARLQYDSSGKLEIFWAQAENRSANRSENQAKNTTQHFFSPAEALDFLDGFCPEHCPPQAPVYTADHCRIPLQSGLVGAVAYEFGDGSSSNSWLDSSPDSSEILLDFAAYPALLAVDLQQRAYSVLGDPETELHQLLQKQAAKAAKAATGARPKLSPALKYRVDSQYSYAQYQEKFGRVHEYLRQGEIYQLNLSQKLDLQGSETEGLFYLRLRNAHPVPFGCFWDSTILSLSPERFFRLQLGAKDWELCARPMKGTRARSRDKTQDLQAWKELRESSKDRAEMLMICDLLRNDLHRVCQNVRVPCGTPFAIEGFPSVWQQTSAVQGTLSPAVAASPRRLSQIWEALFPCGSITGAPKIRAMELIRQLENGPRRWYTGNFGYIDSSGAMEFSVLIRTFYRRKEFAAGKLNYHVGSGLVWDSRSELEWKELELKCRFFLDLLEATAF